MKTKMTKILVVALMLGTLVNYANDKNLENITLNASKVKIEFKSVKKGQSITIKDKFNANVYSQKIKTEGAYSKLFNVSALNNGTYTIELKKEKEIIIKTFKVEGELVTFLKEETKKVHKPVIRTKNELVLISKIDFNNEPLKVAIFYNGDLILSETVNGYGVINKIYKLSETKKGDYSVVIKTDGKKYTEDFTI